MRDSSTRSFSSVGGIHGIAERNRRDKKRKLIISLLIVVSVLIATFTFLIFAEVFGWFEGEDKPPVVDDGSGLEFENVIISSSDVHKGDLILINSSFPYVFPETPANFLSLYTNRNQHDYVNAAGEKKRVYSYYTENADTCARLEETALRALNAMADDFFKATGQIDLFIYDNDGYRSEVRQKELYNMNPSKYAAAGTTEHHTGKATDLYIFTVNGQLGHLDDAEFAGTYSWIYQNAHKYGFVLRYKEDNAAVTGVTNEPYHFRYVGVAHATYMYNNDLCLEEYLDLLRDSHAYKSEHLKFAGDGVDYEVYYVAAASDSVTEVAVPKADAEGKVTYTVSGDNKEGFIVTVEIKK